MTETPSPDADARVIVLALRAPLRRHLVKWVRRVYFDRPDVFARVPALDWHALAEGLIAAHADGGPEPRCVGVPAGIAGLLVADIADPDAGRLYGAVVNAIGEPESWDLAAQWTAS